MNVVQVMKKLNKASKWYGNLRDDKVNNMKVLTILTEAHLNWGEFNRLFETLEIETNYTIVLYQVVEDIIKSEPSILDYFGSNTIGISKLDLTLYYLLEDLILKNSDEEESHEISKLEDRDTSAELRALQDFLKE